MSHTAEVLKHLDEKNYWYKKYLLGNEAYLLALKHAPEVAIDELELFYGNRESLLKIIENIDTKLSNVASKVLDLSSMEKTLIQAKEREKDSMISQILVTDTEIIKIIETIKLEGADKLKLLVKGKKALAKYKSSANYNEKIDRRI